MNRTVRNPAILLAIVSLLLSMLSASVEAQQDTRSHRMLELPTDGTSDIQRQVRLMQHLQSMFDPQDRNSKQNGLTPEQLQMLQSLMQSLGDDLPKELPKDLPQDMLPLLQQLAPELARSVQSDPNSRRQAEDLLRQFMKNRQLPRGAGSNGLPMPGNPQRPNNPPQNSTSPNPSNSPTNPEPNSGSNVQPTRNAQPGTDPLPNPVMSDDRLDRIAEEVRRWNERNRASSSNDTNTQPSGSPSSAPTTPGDADGAQQSWDQRLLERLQEQAALARDQAAQRATGPGSNTQSPTATDPSDNSNGPPSRVADLLRQLDSVPLDQLGPSASESTDENNDGRSDAEAAAEIRKRQKEVRDDLKKQGFRRTLNQIVSSAKSEARQAGSNTNGLNGPLAEVINGVGKDLVEIAKDAKIKFREATKSDSQSGSQSSASGNDRSRSGSSGSRSKSNSDHGGIRQATSEFFRDLAGAAAKPEPASATERPDPNSVMDDASSGSFVALTIAAIVLLAVAFLMFRPDGPLGRNSSYEGSHASLPERLRSRADVVAAFHHVALNGSESTEPWWHHRRVLNDFTTRDPRRSEPIAELTEVYEQARYLPEDEALSENQLLKAEQALRQCL